MDVKYMLGDLKSGGIHLPLASPDIPLLATERSGLQKV